MFDWYAVGALILLFSLFSTLRLAIGERARVVTNPVLAALTHSAWLLPLLVVFNMAFGMALLGMVSPWPPKAFEQVSAGYGYGMWAGIAAFLAMLITDIWVLWIPTQVLRRFAKPENLPALKYYPIFNVAVGGLLLAYAVTR